MKRHILLTLICLLFTCATIFAQNSEPRKGTAYVKGGYEIIGIIIEHQNGDITIKTDNGEQFEFTKKEIRKIKYPKDRKDRKDRKDKKKSKTETSALAFSSQISTTEPNPEEYISSNNNIELTINNTSFYNQNQNTKRSEKKDKSSQKSSNSNRTGYMGIIENNFGGGSCSVRDIWSPNEYSFGSIFDYKFIFINGHINTKGFFVGIGIGINGHLDYGYNLAYVPVFIHIRKTSPRKKTSPYFGLSLGGNFGRYSTAMGEISFGLQAKFKRKGAFWLGAYAELADNFEAMKEYKHSYLIGGIKFGFSF